MPAILAAAALLAAGIAALAGGITAGDPMYAGFRLAVYAAVGGLVGASALVAGRPGAAAAGALAPLVVALGETSQRGLVTLLLVRQAEGIASASWAAGSARMMAHVAPERTAGWVALAAAGVASLVGAVSTGTSRGALAGAVGFGLGALLYASADLPADALAALAALGKP